jgi:hypothetical protein
MVRGGGTEGRRARVGPSIEPERERKKGYQRARTSWDPHGGARCATAVDWRSSSAS